MVLAIIEAMHLPKIFKKWKIDQIIFLVNIFAAFPWRSKWPLYRCCIANMKMPSADIAEAASGTKQPLITAEQAAGFTNDPSGLTSHSQSRVINCGRFKEDLQLTPYAAGGTVIIKQQRPAQVAEGDISVAWQHLRVMADIKIQCSDNICNSNRGWR